MRWFLAHFILSRMKVFLILVENSPRYRLLLMSIGVFCMNGEMLLAYSPSLFIFVMCILCLLLETISRKRNSPKSLIFSFRAEILFAVFSEYIKILSAYSPSMQKEWRRHRQKFSNSTTPYDVIRTVFRKILWGFTCC